LKELRTRKTIKINVNGKGLGLTSKQGRKQNYVIKKQEHKN
jgi:hypothetical protein